MAKNYYIILGVSADSTQSDIKAAYRRLAKEFHPDHFGENQVPFQILQEAYSVLSNPESRRSYDESLEETVREPQPQYSESVRWHYEETIEPLIPEQWSRSIKRSSPEKNFYHSWSVFDRVYDRILGNFNEQQRTPPENLTIEITLSPEQALSGGNVRFKVPFQVGCPSCHRHRFSWYDTCWRCNGAGFLFGEKTVLLNYPPGIQENNSFQFVLRPYDTGKVYLTAIFKIR